MSDSDAEARPRHTRMRTVGYATAGALLVAAHVLIAAVGMSKAAPYLGGVGVTLALVVLVALHVTGIRRLARRRPGAGPAARPPRRPH